MHRAKLTMSWSLCASVSVCPAVAAPACPGRLATGELPGPAWAPDPDEQAADRAAAVASIRARAGHRRPGGRRLGVRSLLSTGVSSSRPGPRPVTRRDTAPGVTRTSRGTVLRARRGGKRYIKALVDAEASGKMRQVALCCGDPGDIRM